MTDKEKLNQLFEAALKDTSPGVKPLARAFPKPEIVPMPAPIPEPAAVVAKVPEPAAVVVEVPEAPAAVEPLVVPMENAGLDHETSTELGKLLDEQTGRKNRKHRREKLITLAACLTLTCGGFGWFVHSPARVQAFHQVVKDIRSTGDIKGMVASYSKALDKVAARSAQIDQSTRAMGVSADQSNEKDPNMDAEMKAMMGGEGKTTGDRSKMLQQAFGKKIGNQETPTVPVTKPVAKLAAEDSFDLNH